jgi:hypothetical protein
MGPPPSLPSPDAPPWVETRAGGVFFVNALLAAPMFVALYPWTVRWLLRAAGVLDRPSRILDPVPAVAAHFAPVVGWLALPALAFTLYGLRIVDRRWARVLLGIFAAGHLWTIVYTLALWIV